jgi:ketosteroid isomerase-like protein
MPERIAMKGFVVLAAVLAGCSNPQPPADSGSDETAAQAVVQAAIDSFHQALRSNDPEAPFHWVADDVVMMPPGEPQVRGKEAMRTWYAAFLGQFKSAALVFDNVETMMGAGWATHAGTFEWTLTPAAGGANVVDRGNFVQVWQRQPDGRWLFAREIWNSTPAAQ